MKATKGNWELQKDNSIVSNGFDKVLIAQVCSANNNDEEQIANGKLLANAKQMYELLNNLVYGGENIFDKANELLNKINN